MCGLEYIQESTNGVIAMDKKLTDSEIVKALNTALGMEHISIYCANVKNEVQSIKVLDIIDLINRLQAENERLKKGWKADVILTANAKAEAYKEFAERLKAKITEEYNYFEEQEYPRARISDIDNILKELVGEDK